MAQLKILYQTLANPKYQTIYLKYSCKYVISVSITYTIEYNY